MKAVILAGGLGTRLLPYTTIIPKPMFPLGGRPVLGHLIEWCKKNKIKSIVLCTSYLGKTIENYFKDGSEFGVDIQYAVSNKPLSTAGQLKSAQKYLEDTFVCMYGDSIYGFDLAKMISQHKKTRAFVTMSLFEHKTDLQYGVIDTKNGLVTDWAEKPTIKSNINMGCYVLNYNLLDMIPAGKKYDMNIVIKRAINSKKKISSFMIKKGFLDIGDIESYRKAQSVFEKKTKR